MKTAPCGSWESPITAEMAASGTLQFSEIHLHQGKVYWLERRPQEKGRTTLLSWSKSEGEKELLPKEYNIRTRVHEYGGGALLVDAGRIFFVNDSDQQVYRLMGGKVDKITARELARFADGAIHPIDSSLFYVMEDHGKEVANSIVRIDPASKEIKTIASGHDFYSNPRVSPDGHFLAYLSWDHPNMPWDGTELWIHDLKTGEKRRIAGGPSESIVDPQWSPDGRLHYVSDRSNWWNLYEQGDPHSLCPLDAEFAFPQWIFGRSLYGFSKDGILSSFVKDGSQRFGKILPDRTIEPIELPYTSCGYVSIENSQMAILASSSKEFPSVILWQPGKTEIIKRCRSDFIDPAFFSQPQTLVFPTPGGQSYGFYYPPANPHFRALDGEKPPLLVHVHGGPTAHDSPFLSPLILYWTSRGFGYLTVNYGGSTGYGRSYRERLKGQWGVVDVEDCAHGALYCIRQKMSDPTRVAIEGGSSGGLTTLASLAFHHVFQVGADHFGVTDMERLALDTHKFESRYLDQIVGPYPEKKALYHERSPVYYADRIKRPVIIFQGDEDAIVPPSQSETMYKSLRERKIPTAYLLFKGEQHGFRKAENIRRALDAQLFFFSKILGFPLSESIEPVAFDP